MLKKLGKEKKIMFTIAIILGIIFIIKIIDNNYQKQDNQNIETGIILVENPKEEQDI